MNLNEANINNEQITSEPRANLERTPSEPREKQKNADQKEDKRGTKRATKSLLFVWLEQRMNREKKGVNKPVPFHLKQERTKRKKRLARIKHGRNREEKALREGGISSCLCCECKCRANCSKANKTP